VNKLHVFKCEIHLPVDQRNQIVEIIQRQIPEGDTYLLITPDFSYGAVDQIRIKSVDPELVVL
jgi:hypothetical protein